MRQARGQQWPEATQKKWSHVGVVMDLGCLEVSFSIAQGGRYLASRRLHDGGQGMKRLES